MGWCERCGRFFSLSSQTTIRHSTTSQGPLADIHLTVCVNCLHPYEAINEYGQAESRQSIDNRQAQQSYEARMVEEAAYMPGMSHNSPHERVGYVPRTPQSRTLSTRSPR